MQAILIGFMGSGKTTIGKLLAQQLNTQHRDLDDLIVAAAGRPITQIFADDGEAAFRRLEHATLANVLGDAGILSCGGGTPVQDLNLELLQKTSVPVILLEAQGTTIIKRVTGNSDRPLVNQLDQAALLKLRQERQAKYHQAADLVIQTDDLTPQMIVDQIQTWLANQNRQMMD